MTVGQTEAVEVAERYVRARYESGKVCTRGKQSEPSESIDFSRQWLVRRCFPP